MHITYVRTLYVWIHEESFFVMRDRGEKYFSKSDEGDNIDDVQIYSTAHTKTTKNLFSSLYYSKL